MPFYPYGVMVLSIGYHATVDSALRWQIENGLTYPVLSDRNGDVTLTYTNWLGLPLLPWDAIVGVDRILAYTAAYVPPDSLWLAEVVEVLDSLFDPVPSADTSFLDFGVVNAGSTAQRILTIDNAGTGLLQIQNVISSSPYYTPNITQGQVYSVEDSLMITVIFDPLEAYGQLEGMLSIVTPDSTLQIWMTALVPDAVGADPAIPEKFSVACFPNPFNPELTLQISLPSLQDVSAELYTVSGDKVGSLYNGRLNGGSHELRWSDEDAPSGIYLVKVEGRDWQQIKKVVLVR